jgi:excisionase family DNA binding protein
MSNKQHGILSVDQAAAKMGCTRQNVLYLLAKGKLDGWQVNGKCWVVRAASVTAYKRTRPA